MARRSNQFILKEISPEYSLEGLMLKLKLQYFGHLTLKLTHLKTPWCWERWKVGEEGDDRGWDGWMASLTQWTWVWVNSGSWWWTGRPGVLQSMGSQSWRWLSDWNELIPTKHTHTHTHTHTRPLPNLYPLLILAALITPLLFIPFVKSSTVA